jgi:predicted dehydrogenase
MPRIRWGVLGAAQIATGQVIPALQQSASCEVTAIASRDLAKAEQVAARFRLSKAYGSYQALLADPDVQAVYIPLPNHLHVACSIAALEAGKHVLCEKPIGLNAAEAQTLIEAGRRYPRLKLMEAFMYRFHPQWIAAKRIVDQGRIGALRAVHTSFSYYDREPESITNRAEIGGGALLDIGCYGISLARFLFAAEPRRVAARVEYDPDFRVDRLVTAALEFDGGQASFTVGTQLAPYQRVQILGTAGRVEIEIPFNAPNDRPTRLWHQSAHGVEEIREPVCNQYTIQGELFSQAIVNDTPVPTPLQDALANMHVIDAVFRAGRSDAWEAVATAR